MRPVGVEARLEPDPSVPILRIWKFPRDMRLHCVAASHGDINFPHPGPDGVPDRVATHISGCRPGAYKGDFSRRFHHALLHCGLRQINLGFWGQKAVERCGLSERQVITLIADHTALSCHRCNCAPVVIALPICIGNVVSKAAAPWLAGVDAGGNGDAIRCGDNQAVGTAKGTV